MEEINHDNIHHFSELFKSMTDPQKKTELFLKMSKFYSDNIYYKIDPDEFHNQPHPVVINQLTGFYQGYDAIKTRDFADVFLNGFKNAIAGPSQEEVIRGIVVAFIHVIRDIYRQFEDIKYLYEYVSALHRLVALSDNHFINRIGCKFPIIRTVLEEIRCFVVQNPEDEKLRTMYVTCLSNFTNNSLKYKKDECQSYIEQIEQELEKSKDKKNVPECNKPATKLENISFSSVFSILRNQFQTQVQQRDAQNYELNRSTRNVMCSVVIPMNGQFKTKLDLALFLVHLNIDILDFKKYIE